MKNYEINDDTYAVIGENIYKTKIIEKNYNYDIDKDAYSVMDESCEYYGSSYKGRLKASKSILDCSYKLPILVEESSFLIFFPIKSSLEEDCVWINLNKIKRVEKVENKTNIIFENNKEIVVDASKLSIDNQIMRSTKLESLLRKRIEAKKRG
jgi:competence protein ComK